jgi:uncharacterized heparinase superfamily protein
VLAVVQAWRGRELYPAYLISSHRIRLLHVEVDISMPSVWNDERHGRLWLYNLHYFDDLNSGQSHDRRAWHHRLIERWIIENPPAAGTGWEPYPISRRVVNWIKWVLIGNDPTEAMYESLAIQARWLMAHLEFHILGNHLLANAKALCFLGFFFSGAEGQRWLDQGLRLLEAEVAEQILPDGGHFELSPMYHLLVLEDLLDVVHLHRVYGSDVPCYLNEAITRMVSWSQVMRHPDGQIPFFNDANFGGSATPQSLDAYAEWLGISAPPAFGSVIDLKESGYVRLMNDQATLFADLAAVGPRYQPGHGHADTLSFEFSLRGRRLIVNGGTSVYGNDPERLRQRGTAAHSTVVVDQRDSSEVWSGFRVARRARVRQVECGYDVDLLRAQGEHDGYRTLPGSPVHRRRWSLASSRLEIDDEVLGLGEHGIDVIFILAPGLTPMRDAGGSVAIHDTSGSRVCAFSPPAQVEVCLDETSWHPSFGVRCPAWRIRLHSQTRLPIRYLSVFSW